MERRIAIDGGIDACNYTLPSSFLIACRTIHLSSKEEVFHHFRLQGMRQLRGVKEIIFDGITRSIYFQMLEGRNLAECRQLDV